MGGRKVYYFLSDSFAAGCDAYFIITPWARSVPFRSALIFPVVLTSYFFAVKSHSQCLSSDQYLYILLSISIYKCTYQT